MASNHFGKRFRITTWGESHGSAIGVVIDGCPPALTISEEEINQELALRAPGRSPFTSPRSESDRVEIVSGVFEGQTTGAPISLIIANGDVDSRPYEQTKELFKPGHAHFSYLKKYGIFDYRGGGRASARETACRVAAGAIAKKILHNAGIDLIAYITRIGAFKAALADGDIASIRQRRNRSAVYCPDPVAAARIEEALQHVMDAGDSLGGLVAFYAAPVPAGLGDPVYDKLEATLAKAMLSIPASKGFEIGCGFSAVEMLGSEHNDAFTACPEGNVSPASNASGGVLGGISTGSPLYGTVAFKPTSSIRLQQQSATVSGDNAPYRLPEGSRHDPCVAIRAVPVVEAMLALVLADAILCSQKSVQQNRSCEV